MLLYILSYTHAHLSIRATEVWRFLILTTLVQLAVEVCTCLQCLYLHALTILFEAFFFNICFIVKAGHVVTVYEKNDRCGGLLMYGIPSMKIEKEVCFYLSFYETILFQRFIANI